MKPSYLLSKKGTALLVVDVQDKFMPVIPHFDNLVDNMTRLILTFQMYDLPIIVTEQYPAGLGPTIERLRKLFTFLEVVEKTELSATDNPHFWAQANPLKANTFVVCGVETHVCINQTVIKLIEKGMEVHVVADATGSRHALDHNVALRKMELAGAHIATTEMCLFELAEKAGTETFKNIQRMVKGKPSLSVLGHAKPSAAASKTKGPEKLSPEETHAEEKTALVPEQEGEKTAPDAETTALPDTTERKSPPVVPAADGPAAPQDKKPPAESSADNSPSVQNLLSSIEKEVDDVHKQTDKSEKEIMNDMKEIDKLIDTIDKK
jgi:nicotinamidase-related amidase